MKIEIEHAHPADSEEEEIAASLADPVWCLLVTCQSSVIGGGPGCVPCDSFMTGPLVYFVDITA